MYFGDGCFWHTQYDTYLIERKGPFGERSPSNMTALAAGSEGAEGGEQRTVRLRLVDNVAADHPLESRGRAAANLLEASRARAAGTGVAAPATRP